MFFFFGVFCVVSQKKNNKQGAGKNAFHRPSFFFLVESCTLLSVHEIRWRCGDTQKKKRSKKGCVRVHDSSILLSFFFFLLTPTQARGGILGWGVGGGKYCCCFIFTCKKKKDYFFCPKCPHILPFSPRFSFPLFPFSFFIYFCVSGGFFWGIFYVVWM